MKAIENNLQYDIIMKEINSLIVRGENDLSKKETARLVELSDLIEVYEDKYYSIVLPKPNNITEIIETKLFEKKMTQAKLAELINMDTPKVSQILNNKRKPDVKFLKAIHNKLGIDGNLLLELA